MALQHLRSSTANKRPVPANMSDGQLAINSNNGSPGLFFKDSNGNLVKVGPIHVGTTAPNASPAVGGTAGNSIGEQWLDTSSSKYVFKIWDGTAWRSEAGEFVDAAGDTMTGALVMDNQQQIRFCETTANGTNFIALQAPASVATDKTLTLPDATGTLVSTGDTGSVTSAMIADSTIVNSDISASAAIAHSKLASITAGQVLLGNASNVPTSTAVTGDVTISSTGVTAIGSGVIVNADINASAAIADTKLATISTAGKVSNSATTATNSNTASAIVARDASGNFSAGTITASLTGAASLNVLKAGDLMTGALGIIAGTAGAPGLYASGDTNTGLYSPGADQLALSTGGNARLFIDSSGRILAGATTALTNAYSIGTALAPAVQISGNTGDTAALSITRQTAAAANLLLQRGVTGTPVVAEDPVGQINFNGFDGTNYFNAALLRAIVDGTPGTNSMPGRLSLQTTPSGSTTPVERLRIAGTGLHTINSQAQSGGALNSTTPAKLYLGTGTYTDTATAASGTVTHGPVVAFDNPAIAASNLTVTYTNASTVYIDGAPTAGTNVTITNPYALYVNAGQTSVPLGSAASPSIVFGTDTNTGIWSPAADTIAFSEGGSEAMRIDSSSRLLVGTSTATNNVRLNQKVGIVSVGNDTYTGINFTGYSGTASVACPVVDLQRSRGTADGSFTKVESQDRLGLIAFRGADGTQFLDGALIEAYADAATGTNDLPTRLVFSTTADGASSPTERMRIQNNGSITFGAGTNTSPAITNATNICIDGLNNYAAFSRANLEPVGINRASSDGNLINFYQDGTLEGSISVSGTTVSYNGAHLSRWSQLPTGAEREEILRGSVLSNIDEMCEWGDEENEQLNRMKVSDVEGDKNVSGVFQAWDDDDDTYTNDFYCAMTGDFIIRIADGVTVERGDLLMSAGDGTAKPQGDGYVQDKTIAKVTSTNVSCTYADGSYCVPCVLMAC